MAKRFDEILDECITWITVRGETVDECLIRYPEHSSQLEPHLRLVARTAHAYSFTPSVAAKERGRQRLEAELRSLQYQEPGRRTLPFSFPPLLLGWRLRWAAAMTVVLLLVLGGGAGLVKTSSNALPGEALYPIKRATEQVRLAFQPSQVGKAELHLAYAENRAREISSLLQKGDISRLEPTGENLREHLATAANTASSVDDEQALSRLRSRLEATTSQALGHLQLAVQEAPEVSRREASNVFQASSEAYGDAAEVVVAKAPERYAGAGPGVLQFRATDPPPPDAEKVLVKVEGVEAHRIGGDESRWTVISQESQTFDLLRVAEVQKFLGEQEVEPGTYSKVRFRVVSVTVVAGGQEHQARVPGGHISLTRPFRVEEGKTTVVLLDFDGERSLQVTGRGEYILTPVIRVFAQEPPEQSGQRGRKQDEKLREPKGKGTRLEESRAHQVKAEVEGVVESVTTDSLVVAGKRIFIAPDSQVKDAIEPGQRVQVEVVVQSDGTFLARKIEVERKRRQDGQGREKADTGAIEIEGVIESIAPDHWIVAGHRVRVTLDTRINGQATEGALARVEGLRQEDGIIVASRITVTPGHPAPKTDDGKGRKEKGDSQGDDVPRKEGTPKDQVPKKGKGSEQTIVHLTGLITSLRPDQWIVDGQTINITDETKIEGTPARGLRVWVEGRQGPDGSILVLSTKVLGRPQEAAPKEERKDGPPSGGTPSKEKDGKGDRVQIRGTLNELGVNRWVVNGETIILTAETAISGKPVVGAMVEVEGGRQPDGSILATKVKLQEERGGDKKGKQEAKPTTTPTPTAKPTTTPAPTPKPKLQPTPTPKPDVVRFQGMVEGIQGVEWRVSGRIVLLNTATQIEGIAVVGSRVRIEGVQREDGIVLATQVKVLGTSD
jgi:hypothetical protein